MTRHQFNETQREQVLELIESFPWGDMEFAIRGFEAMFALSLEGVEPRAIDLWEAEGEARFGCEFELSPEQVSSLDDELRLAYVARLLHSAAYTFGVVPGVPPGRSPEGEIDGTGGLGG